MKTSSHVRRAAPRTQVRTPHVESTGETCDVDVIHLDAVREAEAALPSAPAIAKVADVLAMLSSPTRLRMLLALQPAVSDPRRELCVCDLAMVTGASKSLTSHQLRLLRSAGLVVVRRAGKLAYYRLTEGPGADLLRDALRLAQRDSEYFNGRASEDRQVSGASRRAGR